MKFQRISNFGWIPDFPDHRDHTVSLRARGALPNQVDLRPQLPPVYHQGNVGCCTAAATSAAYVYIDMLKGAAAWQPSLLFLYYNTRALEGAVYIDRGAQIRNALKASAEYGLCRDELMPFEPAKFATKPAPAAFGDATMHQALVYERCPLAQLKQCLASRLPVVFGATIFENFEDTGGAVVPMPSGSVIGGHAMLLVGYHDPSRNFIVRNSWGKDWGDQGYCLMPYDYLMNENLVADQWVIHDTEL